MVDPGTILGIVSLTIRALEKISAIVDEARQFKAECRELGVISAVLRLAIENNRDALTSHEASMQLLSCVVDVEVFVQECTQRWNVFKHAREVFYSHRVPRLRQKLLGWVNVFVLEGSVSKHTGILVHCSMVNILCCNNPKGYRSIKSAVN